MLLQQVIRSAVLIVTISLAIKATSITGAERQKRNEMLQELRKFDETGIITTRLSAILNQLPLSSLFSMKPSIAIATRADLICTACNTVINVLTEYIGTHSPEEILNLLSTVCIQVANYNTEVCDGVIRLNLDSVLYIFRETKSINSRQVCGIFLQDCFIDEPSLEWTIDIPSKPEVNRTNIKEENTGPADILTIVQLSDIHHEPDYLINGNAECKAPMCCKSSQGSPENSGAAAGYWGDYRSCDTPWSTFTDIVQQIKRTHQKIDYIYMTGDIVDHAVWDTGIEKNSGVIEKVLKKLETDFPDTPIYPILGNHEPSPLNVFAPHNIADEKISTKWLYELSNKLWSTWLPPETNKTILHGGFYTVLAKAGLRIIALNNNVCYTFNWWLFYNPKDQDGQLQWLADTLLQAESAGEKVHILAHIPTGDSGCFRTWSREFSRIIGRFENTVTAIFNGHTHNDHFHVYYAKDEPTRPISVAVNGGSVTQFSHLNSNYKVYTVDSATYNILDTESWIFNLNEANANTSQNPVWFKSYSFKEEYGVGSLNAIELDKLAHKLAGNKSLLQKYSRHYDKDAGSGCDDNCLRNRLCYIATSQVGDNTQCDILLQEFDSHINA